MTIAVVGNATVDISFALDRLPEAGETLLAHSRAIDAGGKGLNQAIVAHRAGADVRYLAPIGSGPDAAVIRDRLATEKLAADWLVTQDGPTDESVIWLAADGENAIVSTAARARSLDAGLAAKLVANLAPGDLLLMQGNLSRETTRATLQSGRERGLRSLVNPAPIHFDYEGLWPLIDVAIVNRGELRRLGGDDDIWNAIANLLAGGVGAVVVTLGAGGARWAGSCGDGAHPAPAVEAIDTTGAGDVFCGVLAALLDWALEIADAAPIAVAAAALSVTRRGTSRSFPTAAEIAVLVAGCARTAP